MLTYPPREIELIPENIPLDIIINTAGEALQYNIVIFKESPPICIRIRPLRVGYFTDIYIHEILLKHLGKKGGYENKKNTGFTIYGVLFCCFHFFTIYFMCHIQ